VRDIKRTGPGSVAGVASVVLERMTNTNLGRTDEKSSDPFLTAWFEFGNGEDLSLEPAAGKARRLKERLSTRRLTETMIERKMTISEAKERFLKGWVNAWEVFFGRRKLASVTMGSRLSLKNREVK